MHDHVDRSTLSGQIAELRAAIRRLAADDGTTDLGEVHRLGHALASGFEAAGEPALGDAFGRLLAELGSRVSTPTRTGRPPMEITQRPAHAEREFSIIWAADGTPFGLVIDGTYYRVRPSPGLRHSPGHWTQTIFEAPERE